MNIHQNSLKLGKSKANKRRQFQFCVSFHGISHRLKWWNGKGKGKEEKGKEEKWRGKKGCGIDNLGHPELFANMMQSDQLTLSGEMNMCHVH